MTRKRTRRRTDTERVLADVSEKDLMQQLVDTARWLGYLVYHTYDSHFSVPGFPDLVCVGTGLRAGRIVIFESKTEKGFLSADQLLWLGALMQVPVIDVMVCRPSDVDKAMELLERLPNPGASRLLPTVPQ